MADPKKNIPDSWENRLLAENFDFELKFYIGGQRPDVPEGDIWSLDWNDDHNGITNFDISSTLSTELDMGELDNLVLADASSFLPATSDYPRTVFIEPYYPIKAWERIVYTGKSSNTLTGLRRHQRNVWPDVAYTHPVGTSVHQWVDVTDRILPDFDFTWAREGTAYKWRIPLTGVGYNRELFDGRNMLVCQVRFDIMDGNGWSNWVNWWAGYIVSAKPTKDYENTDTFAMLVAGISHLADLFELPAHHVGKHNIAAGKPTTTSSVLLNPGLERSGEYFGTPEVDGSKAVDEDIDTPWISEGAPSSTDVTPNFPGPGHEGESQNRHLMITEIYFQPDSYGTNDDTIWVELHNQRTDEAVNVQGLYLSNKQTVWDIDYLQQFWSEGSYVAAHADPVTDEWIDGYYAITPGTAAAKLWLVPKDYVIPLPDVEIPALGYLVMHKGAFGTEWTILGESEHYDWRLVAEDQKVGIGYEDHADDVTFDKSGDWLQLWSSYFGGVIDEVFWDDGNGNAAVADHYVNNLYYDPNDSPPNQELIKGIRTSDAIWTGAVVDVSAGLGGKSLRRISDDYLGSCDATMWTIEDFPSPGGHKTFTYGEYISVDLGTIPTVLESDLLVTDTTANVSGGTLGFPPSGTLMLGVEQVPYSSKTGSSFTVLGVGRSQTYPAGTQVFPVITASDGERLETHYPVRSVGWRRPMGKVYPSLFVLMGSNLASPRYPEELDVEETTALNNWGRDALWRNDWDVLVPRGRFELAIPITVAPEYFKQFVGDPGYYRHYMLGVFSMSDGGRVKVGELEAWLDDIGHEDGEGNTHDFEGPTLHEIVKHFYVDHFGLDVDKFTVPTAEEEYFYILKNLDTQKDSLGSVVEDLCRMTGTVIIYQPAFGVRIKKNPQFPVYEAEPTLRYTFSESDIESPMAITIKDKNRIRQVELFAKNMETSETSHVKWPPTPNTYGSPLIMRDVIIGSYDDAEKFAQTRFRQENFMNEISFRVKGIGGWITPTSRIAIDWDENEEYNPLFQSVRYYVTGVTWRVRASDPLNKSWACEVAAEKDVS